MKKLIMVLFLFLHGFAMSFTSLHQMQSPQGLINKFKKYIDSNGKPTVKEFSDGTSFIVTDEAQVKENSWCAMNMPSYKIYVPAGLENVTIGAVAKPNSSYYIWYAFVPDGQDYTEQTLPFKFVKMIDAKVIYQKWNTKKSGWLYLRITQASNFVYSQFGHVDGPRVYLSVRYLFKDDMTNFNNWLKKTHFTSNGDPVEMFSKAYEKSRFCSNYGQLIPIYGNTTGILGASLVSWLQTDDPSLSIMSDKKVIPSEPSDIMYTVNYRVGDKAIDAISVKINNNITDGVLLQNKIDECVKFITASRESGKEGKFIYSDNGENWFFNKDDVAIVDNIRYIGYLIQGDNPKDGKSSQILLAHESGSIKIKVKITQDCLAKSKITDLAVMKYMRDGIEKSVQTSLIIIAKSRSASTTVASNNTGNVNYGGGSGTISNTNYNKTGDTGNDFSYYGDSQQSSINTNMVEKSDVQKDCENNGGRWVDGTCLITGTSSSSTSSSSFSSSVSSSSLSNTNVVEKSDVQKDCENDGGRWVDGTCLITDTSSSSESSNIESHNSSQNALQSTLNKKNLLKVLQKLAGKSFEVKGYFIHYDKNDTFGWAYKSRGNIFAKLDGMDPSTGHLKWTLLQNYFTSVQYDDANETIVVGDINAIDMSE